MKPRWMLWFFGVAALALLALFPLRVAIALSDLPRIGFTARQVAGTIWYGRIGDLQLRSTPLGTFEVQLDPLALMLGKISMRFNRLDDPQGILKGRLIAGRSRGVEDANGRLDVGDMFAPLPLRALEFHDMTVRFSDGRCVEASGRVTPIISAPVPGFEFSGLTGDVTCDAERARVTMKGRNGETVEFYVHASGGYRGWISINSAPPLLVAALAAIGFKPSPQGMTLSVDGQL